MNDVNKILGEIVGKVLSIKKIEDVQVRKPSFSDRLYKIIVYFEAGDKYLMIAYSEEELLMTNADLSEDTEYRVRTELDNLLKGEKNA